MCAIGAGSGRPSAACSAAPPVSGYFLMRLYQGATVTKLVKSGIVPGTLGSLFIVLKTV